jgi:hypothetical protein
MLEYKQLGATHVIRDVGTGKIRCICYEKEWAERILALLQPEEKK